MPQIIPSAVVRMKAEVFGSKVSCLGSQVARIVRLVNDEHDVMWMCFDVETNDGSSFNAGNSKFANKAEFLDAVSAVDQFIGGVFLALPRELENPKIRTTPHMEDETFADMGDAMVEVRTFDTSYIDVGVRLRAFGERLKTQIGGIFAPD